MIIHGASRAALRPHKVRGEGGSRDPESSEVEDDVTALGLLQRSADR